LMIHRTDIASEMVMPSSTPSTTDDPPPRTTDASIRPRRVGWTR
jgi:hypothetical protein